MQPEIDVRIEGRAGRITLCRPHALNALTQDMLQAIEAALIAWIDNPDVSLILIDAQGDKAFAAGGDIRDLYDTGRAGNFEFGQKFWANEYRLNAMVAEYPKPYIALMQGFTMGGGVGVSCHGSHRIVSENAQVSMPECGIGLIPDVGGSLLLARAPGRLGEYLGLTATRMGPADAIYAGFADFFVPFSEWNKLCAVLCETGDPEAIQAFAKPLEPSSLQKQRSEIDELFAIESLTDLVAKLETSQSELATKTLKSLCRNSPLSMSVALDVIGSARIADDIRKTLAQEYRYVFRCMEYGDFLEGIRAAIIDKDRQPNWPHDMRSVPADLVAKMRSSLGENELTF